MAAVIEKNADVAAALVPNSAAIGLRNTPKL